MDAFDHKILAELQQDARQSVSGIAEKVNLSRSAVSERIKRMEDQGEILGYQVVMRRENSGGVQAFFEVRHGGYHCEAIAEQAVKIPGITHCYGISGELDLLICAEAASMEDLHRIRSLLDQVPNIGKVTTHIVMREWGG